MLEETRSQSIVSVGALVVRLGKHADIEVLAISYPDGRLGLPKGHAVPGETPRATALREVLEETGYEVKLGQRLGTIARKGRPQKAIVVFLARPVERRSLQAEESHAWVPLDTLISRAHYPEDAAFLKQQHARIASSIVDRPAA